MKNKKIILISLFLILNLLILILFTTLQNKHQIYLRNLMFSQIVTDLDISNQERLNLIIQENFKTDKKESFFSYLDQEAISQLITLKNLYKGDSLDNFIAINILNYLGKNPSGKICGVPSLGKVVFDVEKGIGCCSDYSKAWIFYSIYLGLEVREVNSLNHTTVEYYDKKSKKWIWIDPYNRSQITNNNLLINQFEARQMTLFEKAEILKIGDGGNQVDLENYSGYSPSQLSVLMWRKGTNFIEVEEWDKVLRIFKLPKSARQLILLITDVSPGWLMLTNDAIGSYLRILKASIYLLMATYFLVNLYLIYKIFLYFQFSRNVLLIKA